MSGYPKIWTTIFNDPWFVSLNLTARGVWLQMIVYAKMVGDTGRITARSWAAMGSLWGCDGETSRKILGNFDIDGKINMEISPKGRSHQVDIEILNYHKYQQLTPKDLMAANGEKTPYHKPSYGEKSPLTRPDQTRPKKEEGPTLNLNVDNLKQVRQQKGEAPADTFLRYIQENFNPLQCKYMAAGYDWGRVILVIQDAVDWLRQNPSKSYTNWRRFLANQIKMKQSWADKDAKPGLKEPCDNYPQILERFRRVYLKGGAELGSGMTREQEEEHYRNKKRADDGGYASLGDVLKGVQCEK
jgi:hypothetical protein